MYAQKENSKENRSKAVANSAGQKKSNAGQGVGFVDKRPEKIAQRKMREIVSYCNNSQLNKTKTIQMAVDNNISATTMQLGKKKGVGNSGSKRQGKKSQRDKKHGLMLDEKYGKKFINWLHAKKQKEQRRDDFTAKEIQLLEVEYLKSIREYEVDEISPQPEFKWPPSDDSDDDFGGSDPILV
jgi:hypothetical protein